MSEIAETDKPSEKKEESSADPVLATVTSPEAVETVNLSVKPEVSAGVIVSVETVNSVQQDSIKLTAVQPSVQNQPSVQSHQTVQSQPSAQIQPVVQNQPTVQNAPMVQSQPTVQNQQTVQNQPTAPSQPSVQSQPSVPNPSTAPSQPVVQTQPSGTGFKSQPDDFYRTIFYFSGMGRVIGSALSEGVYVDEKNRKKAIDPEEIKLHTRGPSSSASASSTTDAGTRSVAGPASGELITSARNQAVNLSSDFRRLQTLLESLPTFTDADQGRSSVTGGGVRVDEPIHGEIYFRSERPEQYQQYQQQQRQRQQQQQQIYIMDQNPISSSHQNMNGHLINVPWNYQNNF